MENVQMINLFSVTSEVWMDIVKNLGIPFAGLLIAGAVYVGSQASAFLEISKFLAQLKKETEEKWDQFIEVYNEYLLECDRRCVMQSLPPSSDERTTMASGTVVTQVRIAIEVARQLGLGERAAHREGLIDNIALGRARSKFDNWVTACKASFQYLNEICYSYFYFSIPFGRSWLTLGTGYLLFSPFVLFRMPFKIMYRKKFEHNYGRAIVETFDYAFEVDKKTKVWEAKKETNRYRQEFVFYMLEELYRERDGFVYGNLLKFYQRMAKRDKSNEIKYKK